MILFVFEGEKTEPRIFETIDGLFLSNEECRIIRCGYDLPTLYSRLKANGEDLFRSLPFGKDGMGLPDGERLDTLFSQIFLFFDYDFQNRMGVERLNRILGEMLDFFDNETGNGKLYINYPMAESLKYTKDLPDANYHLYTVAKEDCTGHQFKDKAERFACKDAKGYKFIDLGRTPEEEVRRNWKILERQNVSKANFIVSGNNALPEGKDSICQKAVFESQKSKYVDAGGSVAILNSFPIFTYDYLEHP